ncbi:MAG: DMT family transporter [Nitrosomonas sp.]|nr:MAG: DMT family transporter [Nitrosomonas sp.]
MHSLWMLVAALMFASMGVLVKYGALYFSSTELVFYRSLFGVWMTYLILRYYRLSVRTLHWRMHCWRGITGLISLLMFFYCLTQLPLATAMSLNYTWPLFVALFSTWILKEHIHWPLVATVVIGFVGVVLLLRPTVSDEQWFSGLLGMGSGFFAAIAYINVKQLGQLGETEWHVVFYFTLISTVVTGIWLLFTRLSPVTGSGLLILLGIGLTATLAQLAMTRAYHQGVTLVVSSLGYSNVLFASLLGIWFWNELLTPAAWLGMALILAGGVISGILGFKQAPAVVQK